MELGALRGHSATIGDRLTYNGAIIETGSRSYRLIHAKVALLTD